MRNKQVRQRVLWVTVVTLVLSFLCMAGASASDNTISLSQGWNFISFPRQPLHTGVDKVLAGADVRIVWGYDNGSKAWKIWKPGGTSNTLATIETEKGYWIFMNTAGTINMSGWAAPSGRFSLYAGWNLTGYSGPDRQDITAGLDDIADRWSTLWTWSGGQWQGKDKIIADLPAPIQPLASFNPGRAYWIKIKQGQAADWSQAPGAIQVTTLSTTNAMPATLVTFNGSGFNPEGEFTVRFFDNKGFSVNIPVVDAGTNYVTASVPPFLNLGTGAFGPGTVNVQVVQTAEGSTMVSNAVGGFVIQDLPTPVTPPGALTLALLSASVDVAQTLRNEMSGTSFDTPALNDAISNQISGMNGLITNVQAAVDNPGQTFEMGTMDGTPITITNADLRSADRMIMAMLSVIGAGGPSPAGITSLALTSREPLDDMSGCSATQASALAQQAEQNPDINLIPGAREFVYAPRTNIFCQIAYAFNTTFKVIAGSAAVALGSLSLAGAEVAALARPTASLLWVTLEGAGGMIGLGGALGQTTAGAKDLVQGGIDKIEEFKWLPAKGLLGAVSPKACNLVIMGLGAHAFNEALTSAQPYGDGTSYTLSTPTDGTGTGTVRAIPGGPNYAPGIIVTLTATPDSGTTFAGWSGCDSVNGTQCTVTMNSNKTVTATITEPPPCDYNHCYDTCWNAYLACYNNCPISPPAQASSCMTACDNVFWYQCPSNTNPDTCSCEN
jgi:hypothetical protein